jgi:hypothetical protein
MAKQSKTARKSRKDGGPLDFTTPFLAEALGVGVGLAAKNAGGAWARYGACINAIRSGEMLLDDTAAFIMAEQRALNEWRVANDLPAQPVVEPGKNTVSDTKTVFKLHMHKCFPTLWKLLEPMKPSASSLQVIARNVRNTVEKSETAPPSLEKIKSWVISGKLAKKPGRTVRGKSAKRKGGGKLACPVGRLKALRDAVTDYRTTFKLANDRSISAMLGACDSLKVVAAKIIADRKAAAAKAKAAE